MIAKSYCTAPGTQETTRNGVPEELKRHPQWVAWRWEDAKKPPFSPLTRRKMKVTDTAACGTFEKATELAESPEMAGVGFVFTGSDAYSGVDLDDCRNPETGEIAPWAEKIIERLDSYTEISPSGRGLKCILRGKLPGRGGKKGRIEVYDRERYFTVTGQVLEERREIGDCQDELEAIYREIFAERAEGADAGTKARHGERFENVASIDDARVLSRARNTGLSDKFRALYDRGDTSEFASRSEADLTLCRMLAFWTGHDREQMDRLFRSSALMRPKWNEKRGESTYGARTIEEAIKRCPQVYSGEAQGEPQNSTARDACAKLEALAVRLPWTGATGPRNRHVYGALIDTGGGYGKSGGEDVRIRADLRTLAVDAGIGSLDGIRRSLAELEELGLIELLDAGRDGFSATYLLKTTHTRYTDVSPPTVSIYVPVLRALRRVRQDTPPTIPEMKRETRDGRRIVRFVAYIEPRNPVRGSIGKLSALLLERIALAGPKGVTEKELGKNLGRRPGNLRRNLSKLLEGGFVLQADGGAYRAAPGLRERLEAHLEETGCARAERGQRRRYEQEREIYARRLRGEDPADEAPTAEDLEANREHAQEVLALRVAEDKEREDERQRRKVGLTGEMFVKEELSGVVAMYWPAMLGRWKERGGVESALRRAVTSVGARWIREWDGYYLEPGKSLKEALPWSASA